MEVIFSKTIVLIFTQISFSELNNKKIFLFAFLSLFLVGCDSIGGVTLNDTKGNKYKFKSESVFCTGQIDSDVSLMCEGSAIKTDIAGGREVIEFSSRVCWGAYTKTYKTNFICSAANKLGKY